MEIHNTKMNFKKYKQVLLWSFFSVILFQSLLAKNINVENIVQDDGFKLCHTILLMTPNFDEKIVDGKVVLNLVRQNIHDTLKIDAKGMSFDSVSIDHHLVEYIYDGMQVTIPALSSYLTSDTFSVIVKYTAHPHHLNEEQRKYGQGAYFINPHQTNPYRKTIFWTQGETEASSCWFPTIEATHQKTTQDLFVTIADTLTSISNGELISSIQNANGTKTEHWQLNKPHAPYLFALVVGPYKTVVAKQKDTPVSYYTLDDTDTNAFANFGRTPEMIAYFSELFRYEYPWDNYKQVTVYDFVAGAMENTTLSVFNEDLMRDVHFLKDKRWENDLIIAHELVHQWFGNLATPRDWSQLSLSESFANFGEGLWLEKWKGKDDADVFRYKSRNRYLHEFLYKKAVPLVQNYTDTPDELFDRHRYNKGGLVLQTLRNYLGDTLFFKSLGNYLKNNEYGVATVEDLQASFEKVIHQKLDWFFNQWYYQPGHPIIEIHHNYDEQTHELSIKTIQKQQAHNRVEIPIFRFLLDFDIYFNDTILSKKVLISDSLETFHINLTEKPLAVNFKPSKNLLCEAEIYHTPEELAYLFKQVTSAVDKVFLMNELKRTSNYNLAALILLPDFVEQHWYVKQKILELSEKFDFADRNQLKQTLLLNLNKQESIERNLYLSHLQKLHYPSLVQLAKNLLQTDSSMLVRSTCLNILKDSLQQDAYPFAKQFTNVNYPEMQIALASILALKPCKTDLKYFEKVMLTIHSRYSEEITNSFQKYLIGVDKKTFQDGLLILKNIVDNEYPNRRVSAAESLIESLKSKGILKISRKKRKATLRFNI